MKSSKIFYKEYEIQYFLGQDNNVMINANEMAQSFNKKPAHFLRNEQTENFIKACCSDENFNYLFGFGTEIINENQVAKSQLENRILTEQERRNYLLEIQHGGSNPGTWMHEILALKFAAWLNPDFEFWVFSKIREITFGNYKKHWDAHVKQLEAKDRMEILKQKMLSGISTQEDAIEYFRAEKEFQKQKMAKLTAIKHQYSTQTKMDFDIE